MGARRAARLPHQHVRPPGGRAGAPGERASARATALRALAEPLGADLWFGVPRRAGRLRGRPPGAEARSGTSTSPSCRATSSERPVAPEPARLLVDRRGQHGGLEAAQIGSTSGHGSASGVARSALLAVPDRLLSQDLLREATSPHSAGPCPILGDEVPSASGSPHDPPPAVRPQPRQLRPLRQRRRASASPTRWPRSGSAT